MYATPEQSQTWLRQRMSDLGYRSLDELAAAAGTDKGNLSRVFRQLQYPRVDALEPLAVALDVSVYELLIRIGAVDPARKDVPSVTRSSASLKWPQTRKSPTK